MFSKYRISCKNIVFVTNWVYVQQHACFTHVGTGDATTLYIVNPNHPGPCVCNYDANIGAHFIETNVKRQSNPFPFKVCSIQHCTDHIQPSTIISKNYFKKCVHFGTTARVIRAFSKLDNATNS